MENHIYCYFTIEGNYDFNLITNLLSLQPAEQCIKNESDNCTGEIYLKNQWISGNWIIDEKDEYSLQKKIIEISKIDNILLISKTHQIVFNLIVENRTKNRFLQLSNPKIYAELKKLNAQFNYYYYSLFSHARKGLS